MGSSQLYGQDFLVSVTATDAGSGLTGSEALMMVLDGHGPMGHSFASLCGEALRRSFLARWPELARRAAAGRGAAVGGGGGGGRSSSSSSSSVEALVRAWFDDAHADTVALLGNSRASRHSGTTATVVAVLADPVDSRKLFVVHANVGDSPALMVRHQCRAAAAAAAAATAATATTTTTTVPLWTDHSVDSLVEYERYRARCAAAGVAHTEWVYSRINTAQGTPHPDPSVRHPLRMYELVEMEEEEEEEEEEDPEEAMLLPPGPVTPPRTGGSGGGGGCAEQQQQQQQQQQQRMELEFGGHGRRPCAKVAARLDLASYATLLHGFPFPGGTQSVRRAAAPGQEHTNWGSTVGGGLQFVRSLGDVNEKHKHFLDAAASVGVLALDVADEVTIVLGSDGFFDCFEYEQPAAIAHAHMRNAGSGARSAPSSTVCGVLLEQMLANVMQVNRDSNALCGQTLFTMTNGVPDWDDIAFTALHVPARTAPAQAVQAQGHFPLFGR